MEIQLQSLVPNMSAIGGMLGGIMVAVGLVLTYRSSGQDASDGGIPLPELYVSPGEKRMIISPFLVCGIVLILASVLPEMLVSIGF